MWRTGDQRGLAMPGAMMAVLLFSVVTLSELHFLQSLEHRQEDQRQFYLALELVHQALECYPRPGLRDSIVLPAGWRLSLIEQPRGQPCVRVSAQVQTAAGRRVTLHQWFCGLENRVGRHGQPEQGTGSLVFSANPARVSAWLKPVAVTGRHSPR